MDQPCHLGDGEGVTTQLVRKLEGRLHILRADTSSNIQGEHMQNEARPRLPVKWEHLDARLGRFVCKGVVPGGDDDTTLASDWPIL